MFSSPAEGAEHGDMSRKSCALSSSGSLPCFLIGIPEGYAVGKGQESRMALTERALSKILGF